MRSVDPHTPTRGREKGGKGKRDLQIEYKNSFTNNTNNANNVNDKRNKAKYSKPTLSFLELGAGAPAAAGQHRQVPGWTPQ